MKLLKVQEGNTVVGEIHPAASKIKEFEDVIEHEDKPERIFAYLFHMYNVDSSYANYGSDMKAEQIKKDLFGDPDWEANEVIQKAEKKYEEMTTTPEQKMLEKATDTIYKLIDYFDEYDPKERDDKGKPLWSTKDLIRNFEKLGGVVDTLEDLRERVDKQEGASGDVRGGVPLNKFNK